MSIREEDRTKSSTCRGLGLVAAAIGVGVGAALYYLANRRSENTPHAEASNDSTQERVLEKQIQGQYKQGHTLERVGQLRERPWSLEECTVCCDVMLISDELKMLPCGHQFHATCIRPWLEQKTTCPNCRQTA